jgi:hypothetical protein
MEVVGPGLPPSVKNRSKYVTPDCIKPYPPLRMALISGVDAAPSAGVGLADRARNRMVAGAVARLGRRQDASPEMVSADAARDRMIGCMVRGDGE